MRPLKSFFWTQNYNKSNQFICSELKTKINEICFSLQPAKASLKIDRYNTNILFLISLFVLFDFPPSFPVFLSEVFISQHFSWKGFHGSGFSFLKPIANLSWLCYIFWFSVQQSTFGERLKKNLRAHSSTTRNLEKYTYWIQYSRDIVSF